MKKREKRLLLSKETLRNLNSPVSNQELAAIIAGTAPGSPSKPNTWPCCTDLQAGVPQEQGRRKPRPKRK